MTLCINRDPDRVSQETSKNVQIPVAKDTRFRSRFMHKVRAKCVYIVLAREMFASRRSTYD